MPARGAANAPARHPVQRMHDGATFREPALKCEWTRGGNHCEAVAEDGVEANPFGCHGVGAQGACQIPGTRDLEDQCGAAQRGVSLSTSLSRNPGTNAVRGTTKPADQIAGFTACGHRQPMLSAIADHEASVRFSLLFVGVQDGGGRPPSRTRASFQARFIASRNPAPMPWPMNGGVRWAASPSRKMLPRRHRSAIWARKVYSVDPNQLQSVGGEVPTQGAISGRSASREAKSSAVSPGSSRNSQR